MDINEEDPFVEYPPEPGDDAPVEKSDWAKIPRNAVSQDSVIPLGWKPTNEKPIPVVQCTQIKKDGNRCGRWSLRGHTKCLVHGGRIPNVKAHAEATVEAARLRLIGMADPAIDVLNDLITSSGTQDAIRLKAATEVLDRAGVKGALDINVEVQHKVDPAIEIARRLEEISKRIAQEEEPELLVLEVVEEEDE